MKDELFGRSQDCFEWNNHSVGISMWHFEWCPKYRYPIMSHDETRAIVDACIRRAANEWNIKIVELNVQDDHVHVAVQIPMNMTPSFALHKLKGASSRKVFEKLPDLRKACVRGHLWSSGKYAGSLGFISLGAAREYIKNQ